MHDTRSLPAGSDLPPDPLPLIWTAEAVAAAVRYAELSLLEAGFEVTKHDVAAALAAAGIEPGRQR